MAGVLIRKGESDLDMETEPTLQEGRRNTDAEVRAKQLQARERGGLLATPEARSGRVGSSRRGFRDSLILPTPLFHTLGLQNHQRINVCSLNHPVCGNFVMAALGNWYKCKQSKRKTGISCSVHSKNAEVTLAFPYIPSMAGSVQFHPHNCWLLHFSFSPSPHLQTGAPAPTGPQWPLSKAYCPRPHTFLLQPG